MFHMDIRKTSIAGLTKIDGMPLLHCVDNNDLKPFDWAIKHKASIDEILRRNGALLIRGLKLYGSKQFGKFLSLLLGRELMSYTYRSTPRTELRERVYTATEYPEGETIPLHNENSYTNNWPNKIGFLCLFPAKTGGETPICDSRIIYHNIPDYVREKFEELGVMYVRNYSDIDLPWTEVFQTDDKTEVEKYCKINNIEYEWVGVNNLRTKQRTNAVISHPITKEKSWFNQAHLFHYSNLDKNMSNTLIKSLGEENIPRNSYYGDGTAIEIETLDLIRNLYIQSKVQFKWSKYDLLLLDNIFYAHGREPFTGQRKVLVGMA